MTDAERWLQIHLNLRPALRSLTGLLCQAAVADPVNCGPTGWLWRFPDYSSLLVQGDGSARVLTGGVR